VKHHLAFCQTGHPEKKELCCWERGTALEESEEQGCCVGETNGADRTCGAASGWPVFSPRLLLVGCASAWAWPDYLGACPSTPPPPRETRWATSALSDSAGLVGLRRTRPPCHPAYTLAHKMQGRPRSGSVGLAHPTVSYAFYTQILPTVGLSWNPSDSRLTVSTVFTIRYCRSSDSIGLRRTRPFDRLNSFYNQILPIFGLRRTPSDSVGLAHLPF